MCRPPQRAFLCARLREKRENELKDATRLVRAMREIAVITARDREHAHEIQHDAADDGCRRHAAPERAEHEQMDHNERNHS